MSEILSKEYLVAIPILGTGSALTFDVGYFYGIDINFFTIFSLPEHLVFALEAAPLAFVASSAAYFLFMICFSVFDLQSKIRERLRPKKYLVVPIVLLVLLLLLGA